MMTELKIGPRNGELLPVSGFSRRRVNIPSGDGSWWQSHDGIRVFSTLVTAKYPDGSGEIGPQWHLSAARPQRYTLDKLRERPTNGDVARVAASFAMPEWEEDNHHPGIARHLWLPVDPDRRVECECKATELEIVEPDGYIWTNPVDGECRGCAYVELVDGLIDGVRCPIHAEATA